MFATSYGTGKAATETLDLSDSSDTSEYSITTHAAGRILLNKSFATVIEAIGASSAGVGSIEVDGVEIATIATVATDAAGVCYALTPVAAVVGNDDAYAFSAGAVIEFVVKTTNSTTGELEVTLALEFADV